MKKKLIAAAALCCALACTIVPAHAGTKIKRAATGNTAKTVALDETGAAAGTLTDKTEYILYIPAGLKPGTRHPLVVALSPGGEPYSMLNAWRSAADRHKWLVFASKVFSNGGDADKKLAAVSSALYNEICLRPDTDCTKTIVTGMSGGAMGSYILAMMEPGMIAAVVANTGMMHENEKRANYPRGKAAVFLASPADFRYDAMKQDRGFLEERGWKTEWLEFAGGHTIAPAGIYERAAQWVQTNVFSTPQPPQENR
ncbi:MAG: hypothetical protein PHW69_01595 [Elusimicrobiaceae bacterium]|nr:hypothetical protein [Elusimicrobiaceae bacterium]